MKKRMVPLFLVLVLLLSACGGNSGKNDFGIPEDKFKELNQKTEEIIQAAIQGDDETFVSYCAPSFLKLFPKEDRASAFGQLKDKGKLKDLKITSADLMDDPVLGDSYLVVKSVCKVGKETLEFQLAYLQNGKLGGFFFTEAN